MKFPWFWITGIAATTILVGAISTGLIHPHMPPRPEEPTPFGPTSFKEDPWEVFVRTDGRYITDQMEQLGMKIERLEKNLADVKSRIEQHFNDSPEMREAWERLKSMRTDLQQLEDRRQRMFLRWNLGPMGPHPSNDSTTEGIEEKTRIDGFVPVPEPETTPSESQMDGGVLEQHRPSIQKLIEIQDEAIRKKLAEQGHFQRLFGQNFVESQMARYTFIYRHFQAQGVQNNDTLNRLTLYYGNFVITGQWFDVNPQMMPQVHRFCSITPNPQSLVRIQKTIAADVQKEKESLSKTFHMEVTRYSKLRKERVFDHAKNTGATDEQARVLCVSLKDFINYGALPSNK